MGEKNSLRRETMAILAIPTPLWIFLPGFKRSEIFVICSVSGIVPIITRADHSALVVPIIALLVHKLSKYRDHGNIP